MLYIMLDALDVKREPLAVFIEHLSLADGEADVGRPGGVDHVGDNVVAGEQVGLVEVRAR